MINYASCKARQDMPLCKCVDTLEDVGKDVNGAALNLTRISEGAALSTVEPAQLATIADVLTIAAEAIDRVCDSLDALRAEGGSDD